MGPRGEHSRAEFTELVVDAAEAIGKAEGLRGLGMRPLAAAIGYAPNSIYNAVGGLDDILLRLNARTLERLQGHLEGALVQYEAREALVESEGRDAILEDEAAARRSAGAGGSRGAARRRVMVLACAYLDFVLAEPKLWGLLFDHVMPDLEVFPDFYAAALAAATDLVAEVLAPLVPDATERHRAVAVLWAALHGLASLATSGKLAVVCADPPHDLARLLVGPWLAGLAAGSDPAEPSE